MRKQQANSTNQPKRAAQGVSMKSQKQKTLFWITVVALLTSSLLVFKPSEWQTASLIVMALASSILLVKNLVFMYAFVAHGNKFAAQAGMLFGFWFINDPAMQQIFGGAWLLSWIVTVLAIRQDRSGDTGLDGRRK